VEGETLRTMSEFETELRNKVAEAEETLREALRAGHDYEIHLHGARIRDLLDRAAQHGIDTADWIAPALLENSGL